MVGPLVHLWVRRIEAKHRLLKQIALTSNNRINLPYTISFKHQLSMAKIFLNSDSCKIAIKYEKLHCDNEREIEKIMCRTDLSELVQNKNVTIKNIKYDFDLVIKLSANNLPVYGRIINIFKKKKKCW